MGYTQSDLQLAIELAKALIQNNNIKPEYSIGNNNDIGDENCIGYVIGDTKYTFQRIVSHYLDNIERIKRWD